MKLKLTAILLTVALMATMTGCGKPKNAEIAMLTDLSTAEDESFMQVAWEGVTAYSEENDIAADQYKVEEMTVKGYEKAIDKAIKGGAKIVIAPGISFQTPVFNAQEKYPDARFILLDCTPKSGDAENPIGKTGANTVSITFAEEQAGYLAGYSVVKDGYTKLGFIGGLDVPPARRYGYGYIQGAEAAAKELQLKEPLEVKYYYSDGFKESDAVEALASEWYKGGTEVIFSCGGPLVNSVITGARGTDGVIIGGDVDQSALSDDMITSATKSIGEAINGMLFLCYEDKFPGGKNIVMDAAGEGISLTMKTSRFKTFKPKDYDAVYGKLAAGEILLKKEEVNSAEDFSSEFVKVSSVKK